ncbi:MAG TPA: RNA polymerase sigma factor [Candidatus Moranbacteria bacterium]|nr:RNA polymerase sigma factor [Candidatus Moranbacteria bacterium]HRZ33634.1 RNA polymerase sigma factor [Candidatus Moranbacteria bacterium]
MARKKKSLIRGKNNLAKVSDKATLKAVVFGRKTDFPLRFLELKSNKKFYHRNNSCGILSDNDLVSSIQEEENFKELFSRYRKKLFIYIFHLVRNKEEAEDVLQNVFSKMYKNINNFDTSRKFSSWIYRIAHNETINFLKQKNRRHLVSWDDITKSKDKLDLAYNGEIIEEKWEHLEIVREIDRALKKLPEKYQQVLKLRYFQEYSYEDIGHLLKKPVNTIGTLINRAKKKLLEVVEQDKFE